MSKHHYKTRCYDPIQYLLLLSTKKKKATLQTAADSHHGPPRTIICPPVYTTGPLSPGDHHHNQVPDFPYLEQKPTLSCCLFFLQKWIHFYFVSVAL